MFTFYCFYMFLKLKSFLKSKKKKKKQRKKICMFLTYFHNLLDTLMLTFHNFFYSFKTQFLHFYLIFMFSLKLKNSKHLFFKFSIAF